MNYSLSQFETDIESLSKPRLFDTYILPGFLLFYALRSKSAMSRSARRILFTAGIYMVYRNYAQYKATAQSVAAMVSSNVQAGPGPVSTITDTPSS